jgi:hypothetical protein
VQLELSTSEQPAGSDNEGFSQEWFEEDYGFSDTELEAEELRLRQLEIEQEASDNTPRGLQKHYFYYNIVSIFH